MKIIRFLFRILLASLQLFFIQILLWNLFYMISKWRFDIENILSGSVYIFFYFFIFYYFITLVASFAICKFRAINSWLIGQIFAIIGYCAFRFGDILDGDFIKNFITSGFLSFIVLGIFIKLIIENTVTDKFINKSVSK